MMLSSSVASPRSGSSSSAGPSGSPRLHAKSTSPSSSLDSASPSPRFPQERHHATSGSKSEDTDQDLDLELDLDATLDDEATHGHVVAGGDGGTSSRSVMIFSWLSLLGSVVSMSATGPAFLYMQRLSVSPILACVWRGQCTCMFLLLPAWFEWRSLPASKKDWEAWRVPGTAAIRQPSVTRVLVDAGDAATTSPTAALGQDWHVIWFLCAVSVVWSCSLVLWVSALPFTTTARASLLTSIYPLLLVLYLKFGPSRVALSMGEVLGVLLSFLGIAVCEVASMSEEHPEYNGDNPTDPHMLLVGDALCLASAVFIAADIVISKKARQVVPLFIYTLCTCLMTLCLLTLLSVILEATTLSRHPEHGLLGWMRTEHDMVYLNIFFGVLEGGVGLLGFNYAVAHLPHLVFSSVQLLDPGVTGLMSWLAGLEAFPTKATGLGFIVVSCGIACVVVSQHRREQGLQEAAKKQSYQMVPLSEK